MHSRDAEMGLSLPGMGFEAEPTAHKTGKWLTNVQDTYLGSQDLDRRRRRASSHPIRESSRGAQASMRGVTALLQICCRNAIPLPTESTRFNTPRCALEDQDCRAMYLLVRLTLGPRYASAGMGFVGANEH